MSRPLTVWAKRCVGSGNMSRPLNVWAKRCVGSGNMSRPLNVWAKRCNGRRNMISYIIVPEKSWEQFEIHTGLTVTYVRKFFL